MNTRNLSALPNDVSHVVGEYGLRSFFPKSLQAHTDKLTLGDTGKDGRKDLRSHHFFTIDGSDAKDFDDALCITARADGGFELMVAIADVAHYVPRESALDREALKRGTSVYFHDYCIPMLPPKLSEELCSLKPKVDRLVVVVEMILDRSGVLSSYQFFRGVIHSKQRFTYDEVNQYLSGEKDPPASSAVALKDLQALRARLLEQRLARKALHFERKELHMTLTKKRTIQSIGYRTSGESQSIVEECMILANQCAAQFLSDHYPKGAVYRTHEVPSEDSLTTLNKKLVLFSINASIPAKKKADVRLLSNYFRQDKKASAPRVFVSHGVAVIATRAVHQQEWRALWLRLAALHPIYLSDTALQRYHRPSPYLRCALTKESSQLHPPTVRAALR